MHAKDIAIQRAKVIGGKAVISSKMLKDALMYTYTHAHTYRIKPVSMLIAYVLLCPDCIRN